MQRIYTQFNRSTFLSIKFNTGLINPNILSNSRYYSSSDNELAIVSTRFNQKVVEIKWNDGRISKFHHKWLRDHCYCEQCVNKTTKQRQLDTSSIRDDCCPLSISASNALEIQWNTKLENSHCLKSQFSLKWLRDNDYSVKLKKERKSKSILWGSELQLDISSSIVYSDFMQNKDKFVKGMNLLHQYGILLVKETPKNLKATESFAQKIGLIKKTIYGEMWSTSIDDSKEFDQESLNDSAYSNLELHPHTDCTYLKDPPGLQIFNCAVKAEIGGENYFVDGFHVGEILRKEHPKVFDFFVRVQLPFSCYDNDISLKSCEPMLLLDENKNLLQFRYNDYDRTILNNLSFDDIEKFYDYHSIVNQLIRSKTLELIIPLEEGQMVIVENHRVLHGRAAFEGKRSLLGCYIGNDEYKSRLRSLNII